MRSALAAIVVWVVVTILLGLVIYLSPALPAAAADLAICKRIDPAASEPIAHEADHAAHAEHCIVRISPSGHPLPDPVCTPGAVNPTVTIEILRDPAFRTSCLRDKATKPQAKAKTYETYKIKKPRNNRGKAQTCELDHKISLEVGGADTLDNIWPQCGPDKVELKRRHFKVKDLVENYVAKEVRSGRMKLRDAQEALASDWSALLARIKGAVHRKR